MQIFMQITEIDKAGRSDFFLLRTCGMKKYEMLNYRPRLTCRDDSCAAIFNRILTIVCKKGVSFVKLRKEMVYF